MSLTCALGGARIEFWRRPFRRSEFRDPELVGIHLGGPRAAPGKQEATIGRSVCVTVYVCSTPRASVRLLARSRWCAQRSIRPLPFACLLWLCCAATGEGPRGCPPQPAGKPRLAIGAARASQYLDLTVSKFTIRTDRAPASQGEGARATMSSNGAAEEAAAAAAAPVAEAPGSDKVRASKCDAARWPNWR